MLQINYTKSICHKCQKIIPAKVFEKNGRVFIESRCPEHGETVSEHVWDDPELYRGLRKMKIAPHRSEQIMVEVTKRCNMSCSLCYAQAKFQKDPDRTAVSNKDQFKIEDLENLRDCRRVYLSGGEPTVREDLPAIIERCQKNNQRTILFSNGIKLADWDYAKKLKDAGLGGVMIQLDTLDEKDNEYIRGKNLLKTKIKALRNLNKLNIPVICWTVVLKDRNLRGLAKLHRFVFRFPNIKTINTTSVWRIGRFYEADFTPISKIVKELGKIYPGLDKSEFISNAQLLCNIDRVLSGFSRKRGRVIGACKIKAMIFEYRGRYLKLREIIDVDFINREIDKALQKQNKVLGLLALMGKILTKELIINFIKNKYFRAVVAKFIINLRFVFLRKYSLINPFRLIAVGSYPSVKNFDLDFIRFCNNYLLSNDDHRRRPACMHYIQQNRQELGD